MSDECRNEFEELKPCPFCGSEADIEISEPHSHIVAKFIPDSDGHVMISCSKCSCAIMVHGQSRQSAIDAWNRRATAVVSREAVAKIVEQSGDENWTDGRLIDALCALQLPAPQPVSTAEPVAWAFDTFPSGRGLAFENPYRNDSEEMNRRQNVVPLFSRPPVPSPVVVVQFPGLEPDDGFNDYESAPSPVVGVPSVSLLTSLGYEAVHKSSDPYKPLLEAQCEKIATTIHSHLLATTKQAPDMTAAVEALEEANEMILSVNRPDHYAATRRINRALAAIKGNGSS